VSPDPDGVVEDCEAGVPGVEVAPPVEETAVEEVSESVEEHEMTMLVEVTVSAESFTKVVIVVVKRLVTVVVDSIAAPVVVRFCKSRYLILMLEYRESRHVLIFFFNHVTFWTGHVVTVVVTVELAIVFTTVVLVIVDLIVT
jgi:hypothetical protein